MAKQFRCPQCQKVYRLPETFTGGPVKCACGKISKIADLKPERTASTRLAANEDGMSGFLNDMAAYEDEAEEIDLPKPPPPQPIQMQQPAPPTYDMSMSAGMNSGAPLPYETYQPRPSRRPRSRSSASNQIPPKVISGFLWMAGGIVVTAGSYHLAAPGGTYIITWGAIIFGGIEFLVGLAEWMK